MKNYFMMLLLCAVAAQSQTKNYTTSTEILANPERGFYHYRSTGATGYSALSQTELTNFKKNEKVTLIWREFRLDAFKTTAITAAYLAKMQTDFTVLRAAGVKAVVRFNYTNTDGTDASKTQIFAHIDQLKSIISANEDVISSVEAGFIGNYGEWYYSNNFGTDNLTTQNKADRLAVGLKIMELAPHRMVAFRTPTIQRQIAGASTVTSANAYNGSVVARTAAHNDCFLSSSDDYGTYINATTDYTYLENQSKYTFGGGETCSLTSFSACTNAVATMSRFHFNYLNTDYNQDVTSNWAANGCMDDVKRKLGYRFELLNSTVASNAITLNLQNVGFGNVLNDRKAFLIYKNTSTGAVTSVEMTGTNVRQWVAGVQTRIVQNIGLGVANGTYQLYLNLPDAALSTNPNYSIQLANTGLWDANTGYNDLQQTISVSNGVVTTTVPPASTETAPVATALTVSIALVDNYMINAYNLPCTEGNYTVAVYNQNGKRKSTSMNISGLKKGIYFINITCNGTVYTGKIIKV